MSGEKKSDTVNNSAAVVHFWEKLTSLPEHSRSELSLRSGDMQSVNL
jgi:hypothetical protein